MGKGKRSRPERHKQSLGDQVEDPQTYGVRTRPRNKRQKSDEADEDQALDDRTAAKIMREAREQREAFEAEANPLLSSVQPGGLTEDLGLDSDSDEGEAGGYSDTASAWEEGEVEVSPEDEAAMAAFLNPAAGLRQRTLADIILEKIQEKQARQAAAAEGGQPGAGAGTEGPRVDAKVAAVYKGVGQIMRRFTTGKVPKAFKIIPKLANWEEVLYLTDPENWSPHAVYQATRLFVSSLNARLAQRFLALVLLPHVRRDIQQNRRLHFALFQALKKATFKPDAFFKGVLLPLCRGCDCTLREAVIISSVINRTSIPVAHSGAALLRLAELPYCGTTSFFIRVLLDKKYALPYRVVDAMVDHFLRFQTEERTLPVVWHLSLLVFVQRYKHEIRREDQEALRRLVRAQFHYKVSPEIHRELEAARARGERAPAEAAGQAAVRRQAKPALEDPRNLAPVLMMDED